MTTVPSLPFDGNGEPPGGIPPSGTASGRPGFQSAKSAMENGNVNEMFDYNIKFCVPIPSNGNVNPCPLITTALTHIQRNDHKAAILSKDKKTLLFSPGEIPSDERIYAYATDIQTDGRYKQAAFHFIIRTSLSFKALKGNNIYLRSWLRANNFWMKYHDHSSNQTYSPGFIFNMHPDFHSRMEMKNVLESDLENIEVSLVPNSDFYLTNANGVEQKVYVKVVEVHVAANQTSEARQGLAKAFDENDPDLANKEFIPRPQRGIMPIETYRAALAEHRSLTTDQRSFSITGVKDMDNARVAFGSSTYPLKEYILTKIIGNDKKPIFNDIAPTKMVKEGRFLLLTHKDKMDEAQEAIDAFTSWLDKTGQQTTLAHPGKKIKRTNPYSTGPRFSKHANKITAKFSLTAAAPPAPPPTNNPWNGNNKRTVQLVVGNSNEFPPLANATSNDEQGTSTS
jgi:hypothetical protein